MFRYNEAKELAKNLEKQAGKVQAEAKDAGDKALKIFANLTSVPPLDTKALEVTVSAETCSDQSSLLTRNVFYHLYTNISLCFRMKRVRSRRRRRTSTS